MSYKKTIWKDFVTPLDENNMNNIENGIEHVDQEVHKTQADLRETKNHLAQTDINVATNKQSIIDLEVKHDEDIKNLDDKYTKEINDTNAEVATKLPKQNIDILKDVNIEVSGDQAFITKTTVNLNEDTLEPVEQTATQIIPDATEQQSGLMTKATVRAINQMQTQINQLSNPNLLINGDFRVNQRGETSYSNFANKYCVDRWRTAGDNVTVTPMDYGCSVSVGEAGQYYSVLEQIIEDYASLIGKTVTLSANIKSVSVNLQSYQYCIRIRCYDTNNEIITTSESWITTAGNYSCTLTIPSNTAKVSCTLYKNAVVDCTFEIEYMKLEIGNIATPYSPRPYAEELALCQRYYQVVGGKENYGNFGIAQAISTSQLYVYLNFLQETRIKPTITLVGNLRFRQQTSSGATNIIDFLLSTTNYVQNNILLTLSTTNTLEVGAMGSFGANNDNTAKIIMDAEIY